MRLTKLGVVWQTHDFGLKANVADEHRLVISNDRQLNFATRLLGFVADVNRHITILGNTDSSPKRGHVVVTMLGG